MGIKAVLAHFLVVDLSLSANVLKLVIDDFGHDQSGWESSVLSLLVLDKRLLDLDDDGGFIGHFKLEEVELRKKIK